MGRVDVHCHVLPGVDDGCRNVAESLAFLQLMGVYGYTRLFCTPHVASGEHADMTISEAAERVERLRQAIRTAGLAMEVKPGGEVRLGPELPELFKEIGIPSYGHQGKYVLVETWEEQWPAWGNRVMEWFGKQGLTVVLAHPERMTCVLRRPALLEELSRMGILLQGNLQMIGGHDHPEIVAMAERLLKDGKYFMVGSDGHRIETLQIRLNGLARVEEMVGAEGLERLTVVNPGKIWDAC